MASVQYNINAVLVSHKAAAKLPDGACLKLFSCVIYHPFYAKFICQGSVIITPKHILQRHFYFSTCREFGKNQMFIPWLQQQYKTGVEIASFCTGVFLFGTSGLLDGRMATTHVDACSTFASSFPSVLIKPGQTVTVDERCYTSGGSTSTFF